MHRFASLLHNARKTAHRWLPAATAVAATCTASVAFESHAVESGADEYAKALAARVPQRGLLPKGREERRGPARRGEEKRGEERTRQISVENVQIITGKTERLSQLEALYSLQGLRGSGARFVCQPGDVDALSHEVCAVLISRGAPFAVADKWHNTFQHAAQRDTIGLTWYIISDSTPDAVADALAQRFRMEIPASFQSGGELSSPTIFIFDKFNEKHEKYIMPQRADVNTEALEGVKEEWQALAAALPGVDSILDWCKNFSECKARPSLMGEERPTGDRHPTFPFLSVVVSSSFEEVVLDPGHDVVLEAYMSDCPMCMALGARVRMLAYLASRYFPHVKVAAMNVDDNDRPKEWMPGPAFPTIQLFNTGDGYYSKLNGPTCPQCEEGSKGHEPLREIVVPEGVRRIGCAAAGTPRCIPSLAFEHPTNPGRMAMPTMAELAYWVARYGSTTFDPANIAVDEDGVSTLLELCNLMEKDAEQIERGIFQLFFFMSLAQNYKQVAHGDAAKQKILDELDTIVAAAKMVIVDRGMYGMVEAVEGALDALEDFVEEHRILHETRQFLHDQSESKAEAKALDLARQLV